MWSFNIKPNVIEHGRPGKYNKYVYVVDIMLSSSVVERHIFFNSRKYESFSHHLSRILPSYSGYCSGLSYFSYYTFYSLEEYEVILNLG